MKLVVFTDGASRGNPGPSSYGFTISDENKKLIYEEGKYIGETTNNVAEYTAVLEALKFIKKEYSKLSLNIAFFADSLLVASQLSGMYKIKSQHLKELILQIKNLEKNFEKVTYQHVPRSQNTLADKLANQALDKLNV